MIRTSPVHSRWMGLVLLVLLIGPALAEECRISVTVTGDDGPGSLRSALERAAEHHGPCHIDFGDRAGPFATPQTIRLASPLPRVVGDVTIDGFIDGLLWRAYGATLSGGDRHRILDVAQQGRLVLRGVTLRDGRADQGGAIRNAGVLALDGLTLTANRALEFGGAVANLGGIVNIVNTTGFGNRAPTGGFLANVRGESRLVHVTLTDNTDDTGSAIFNRDRMRLDNAILSEEGLACESTVDAHVSVRQSLVHGRTAGCPPPLLSDAPGLERPGYFNGPTQTIPLGAASPAVNMAQAELSVDHQGRALVWDQRGNGDPRFAAGFADLGAFERQSSLPGVLVVDTLVDSGLRNCTGLAAGGCSLRAAIELAGAGRHHPPIQFDAQGLGASAEFHLVEPTPWADVPLRLHSDEVRVRVYVPDAVAWRATGKVEVILEDRRVSGD